MAGFIYFQSFCQKSAEKKIFVHILFRCLTWETNPGFTPNKPAHYLRRLLLYLNPTCLDMQSSTTSRDFFEKGKRNLKILFCREVKPYPKKLENLSLSRKLEGVMVRFHFKCIWRSLSSNILLN